MLICRPLDHLCHTSVVRFQSALIMSLIISLLSLSIQMPGQTPQKPIETSTITQDRRDVLRLEQGKPVERALKGGEVHVYEVALTAGQYFKAVVEQKGIDVVVNVFAPDGKQVMKVNSPNGTQEPESVSVIAADTGNYRLEVRSLEKDVATARYEVKVTEVHTATLQDRSRVAAGRVSTEADLLREQRTPEFLKKAIGKYEEALAKWREAGDRKQEGITLNNLGNAYYSQGQGEKARQYYDQALAISRETMDRMNESRRLYNIGNVYLDIGEFDKGREYFEQSLVIAHEMKWRNEMVKF